MKVFIWEDAAQESIDQLQQLGADFEFEVSSEESSLVNALEAEEQMCVVLVDIDQLDDRGLSLNKQIESISIHRRFFSSQCLSAKDLKALQDKGLTPDAFFKRPHNYEILLQTLNSVKKDLMQDKPVDMTKGGTAELDIDPTMVTQIEASVDTDIHGLPGDDIGLGSDQGDTSGAADELLFGDDEDNKPTKILDMIDVQASTVDGIGNDGIDIEFSADSGESSSRDCELTETEIGLFPNDEQQAMISQSENSEDDGLVIGDAGDDLEFDVPSNQPHSDADNSLSALDLLNDEKDDFDAQSEASGQGSIEVFTSQKVETYSSDNDDATLQTVINQDIDLGDSATELETQNTVSQTNRGEHEAATTTMMVDTNTLKPGELRAADEDEKTLAQEAGDDECGDTDATIIQGDILSEFRPSGNVDEDKTLFSADINDTPEDATVVQSQGTHVSYADMKRDHEAISQHNSNEILRLKVTIENLREDREHLLAKLADAEKINNEIRFKMNSFQSELDEAKIELGFLKKRYDKDIEEAKYALDLSRQKKEILEDKNKEMEKELDLANQKLKFDFKKVKEREQQLEGQLELLKADSENLLRNRDNKILDLKRSIDSLEFDVESSQERERKAKHDKHVIEDKLERIMSTLRRTIGSLDEDLLAESASEEDKKLKEL